MSSYLKSTNGKHPGLKGISFDHTEDYCADKSMPELRAIFSEIMEQGMHGICYSAYEEGQEPGDHLLGSRSKKGWQSLHLTLVGSDPFHA